MSTVTSRISVGSKKLPVVPMRFTGTAAPSSAPPGRPPERPPECQMTDRFQLDKDGFDAGPLTIDTANCTGSPTQGVTDTSISPSPGPTSGTAAMASVAFLTMFWTACETRRRSKLATIGVAGRLSRNVISGWAVRIIKMI